ncbi:MAG: sigma-70 family RNA polymerase sigma factor [Candidatus Promineifilaceae bacterium]
MENEQRLLTALRQGEAAAFEQLFDTYSDKIYRLAAGLLEDDVEAEGVVQDSFLRLFEYLDRFEGRSKIGTWLYRVAYNASMDRLRKRRPSLSLTDERDHDDTSLPPPVILTDWRNLPERLLTEAEINSELDRAITALPERLRAAFILYEIEGLSVDESAEVLGISVSAAKVRLHRARLALRERLAESFSELVTIGSER